MGEAVEKSIDRANQNFQNKTVRGGGGVHNQNPSVFCHSAVSSNLANALVLLKTIRGTSWGEIILAIAFTYMSKNLFRKVAVGKKPSSSPILSDLRLYVVGTFGCLAAAVVGKKAEPNLSSQAMVEK